LLEIIEIFAIKIVSKRLKNIPPALSYFENAEESFGWYIHIYQFGQLRNAACSKHSKIRTDPNIKSMHLSGESFPSAVE